MITAPRPPVCPIIADVSRQQTFCGTTHHEESFCCPAGLHHWHWELLGPEAALVM